jgi:hypothetical protein
MAFRTTMFTKQEMLTHLLGACRACKQLKQARMEQWNVYFSLRYYNILQHFELNFNLTCIQEYSHKPNNFLKIIQTKTIIISHCSKKKNNLRIHIWTEKCSDFEKACQKVRAAHMEIQDTLELMVKSQWISTVKHDQKTSYCLPYCEIINTMRGQCWQLIL